MGALLLLLVLSNSPPDDATLPDALPPLDESLVEDESSPPFSFFGQARMRSELDQARDFSRAGAPSLGVALTARVGVDAALTGGRLILVVGDAGRLGLPSGALPLVKTPVLPQLWQAELALDIDIAGIPSVLSLGRMPIVVGDGRLVGVEPFDPRGRTLDGAKLFLHGALVDTTLGALWLGPMTSDASDVTGAPSGLVFLDTSLHVPDLEDKDLALDAHVMLHRDGPQAATIPTAGMRLGGRFAWLSAAAALDAQAPFLDDDANADATPTGYGTHASLEARARARLSDTFEHALDPYVRAVVETTAGNAVVNNRVLTAPAATQHGVLGVLDLVAPDNTWSTALGIGATTRAGLLLDVTGRLIGIVSGSGPLLDTAGAPLLQRKADGLAIVELDAKLELPLNDSLGLGVEYGVAVPGAALIGDEPAQRLLVTLRAGAASRGSPPSASAPW